MPANTSSAIPSPSSRPAKLAAVKGMNDVTPPESARWEWLEHKVRTLMGQYAYRNMRTPILEHTALFVRGIGEVTDIVEKEMYSFQDRSDKYGDNDHLALRPENTAGVVRAAIEHNMLYDGPKRLWYIGPMFRREKPQRGRFRQFHQIGAEALGFAGPDVDAELILMANAFWRSIGLTGIRLEINSLGQPSERAKHRQELIAHFEQHLDVLDEDAKRRLHTNPLRILDTKNPTMKAVVESAPQLMSFLGEESLAHFRGLQAILDANRVEYTINHRLVRGLDYYNLSVFEFVTDRLGAQGTVCAGGRYDDLIAQVGGKPAPAVGWAIGVERILELLTEQGVPVPENVPDVYAVVPDAATAPVVLRTLLQLREMGVRVQMHAAGSDGQGSFKSQFKRADSSGATYALIFGSDELARGTVTVKPLRDATAVQVEHHLDEVSVWGPTLQSSR
ncbi:histidine--tRNA ligase [Acidovorax sp. NCPPB 4044]|uniref:histidine--tRNA ligase n=1 Tax=Acidovorax sp. NCPPB 4044 TaxID=2940490 RepID=UPI0023049DD1|nr:histidine--tRNA ligase [Acidovorax sp. NCPPB 4044]MDA8519949.1 histidine--tRNA ligase [Acidovorax sp. NCPPB 4044]